MGAKQRMFNTVNTSLSGLWHQLYWCNFLTTVQKNPTMALTPPTQHPHTCESSRYLKEIHLLDKQKVSFYMETEGFNTKRSVLHKCSNSGKYGNVDMLGKKALRFLSCLTVLAGGKEALPLPSGFWNAAEEPVPGRDGHCGAAGPLHTVRGQRTSSWFSSRQIPGLPAPK